MSDMDFATAIIDTAVSSDPASSSHESPATTQQTDDAQPAESDAGEAVDSPNDTEGEGSGEKKEGEEQPKLPTSQQVRAALKAFRDGNPDHIQAAKILNDSYGRAEAFKQVFPTVDEARAVRTQLDAIGGLDGLAQLQSDRTAYEATDDAITSGDPAVLDALIEDAPDGFKKLAPHYINKLQKLDPEAYGRAIQPHFVKALTDANFLGVTAHLHKALADKPELQAVVADMINWFNGQKQLADKYGNEINSPENEKLAEGWKQLETERRTELQTYVRSVLSPHISSSLGTLLKPYSEALNAMPIAQRKLIAANTMQRLGETLEKDKNYQAQLKSLYSSKKPDRNKIVDFNKQKVSELAPKIIAEVVKDFSLAPNSKPGPKNGQRRAAQQSQKSDPNTPRNIVQLAQAPADKDIDWKHQLMSEEAYIRGRAVLKDGRWVQWKK